MSKSAQTSHRSRFKLWHYALALMLAWTAVVAVSLVWSKIEERTATLDNARHEAQISFQKELLLLFWMNSHGGSAPATNNAPPSPEPARAAERALVSEPMLRQMQELSTELAGNRSHLASLKPLRPENAPDTWETGALQAFAQGETEVASVTTMDGQKFMRVMRPLVNEASCQPCHGAQDYKVGDIRGGPVRDGALGAAVGHRAERVVPADHHQWRHLGVWARSSSVSVRAGRGRTTWSGLGLRRCCVTVKCATALWRTLA